MILAAVALVFATQPPLPAAPVNPGFEAGAALDSPYQAPLHGWTLHPARGYRAIVRGNSEIGGVRAFAGRQYLFLGYFARNAPDRGSWIRVSQTIDARRWQGRCIRVSVAANPAHFAADRGWLAVRAGPASAQARFPEVERWRRYAVELGIPRDATSLTIEIGTTGDVSVDDLRIEPIRR